MANSFLTTIDKQITAFLGEHNIESRKDAGAGVWLSTLLPISFILGGIKYETSLKYQVAICICGGMLLHSVINMFHAYNYKTPQFGTVIISCIAATSLLFSLTAEGLILSILFGTFSIFIYDRTIIPFMKLCPKNFTYGECTVVCQGFTLFLFSSVVRETQAQINCFAVATSIIQFGIICLMGIVTIVYYYSMKNKPLQFYSTLGFTFLFILMPSLYISIGDNALIWIFNLFTQDKTTIILVIFWIFCSIIGGLAVMSQISSENKASTVNRKIFHGLILLVFVPAIVLKPCMIYLSSGVVLAIFLILDMIRILKMPPLGETLQSGFIKFADEKDEGPLALTPVYLLIGCSLPLWIHPDIENSDLLPLLAGLLSVGVGDSAASICGSFVGKNKWPGSKKTKEGTAACFLSQLFVVILLIHLGYVPRTNLIKPTFAIATSSFVEARTDQVDNLALPLIMYVMML